jgi:hypothetical protein
VVEYILGKALGSIPSGKKEGRRRGGLEFIGFSQYHISVSINIKFKIKILNLVAFYQS